MNVLGMGPMELLLILVLALIVFGPGKLPEIMGQLGRAVQEFRKVTSEMSDEFNRTIKAEIEETKAAAEGRSIAPVAAPQLTAPAGTSSPEPEGAAVPSHAPPIWTSETSPNGEEGTPIAPGAENRIRPPADGSEDLRPPY